MMVVALAGGVIALHSPLCALLFSHGHPRAVVISSAAYVALLMSGLLLPGYAIDGAAYAVLAAAVFSTSAYA